MDGQSFANLFLQANQLQAVSSHLSYTTESTLNVVKYFYKNVTLLCLSLSIYKPVTLCPPLSVV